MRARLLWVSTLLSVGHLHGVVGVKEVSPPSLSPSSSLPLPPSSSNVIQAPSTGSDEEAATVIKSSGWRRAKAALSSSPLRRRVRQQAPATAPERPRIVQESLSSGKALYYFGLGSNMSRKKLENRGLNNTKIDILSMQAAVVPNYRLAFNLRGFPPIEPGMGSLEPSNSSDSHALLAYQGIGDECHGALVKLTPENYEKVMRSEGVGNGNSDQGYEEIVVDAYPYPPNGFWKQRIAAVGLLLGGAGGGGNRTPAPVKAIALRARPHVRLKFDPCPSLRYMTILREGAKELGLKPCYQEFLEEHPVQKLEPWQKRQALYNLLFTFSLSTKLNWRGVSRLQSRLLFAVYTTPTTPSVLRGLSTVASTVILLPGSILGWAWLRVLRLTGQSPPPFYARLVTMLEDVKDDDDDDDDDNDKPGEET